MLYILHGPDGFTQSQKIAELKASLGDATMADLNLTVLEGRNLKLAEIQHHANAIPFLADKRVVIVKGFLTQLGRKKSVVEPVIDYVAQLSPTTDLVFVESESLDKRHPMLKLKSAEILHFDLPTGKTLINWIRQRVKQEGATIQPDAADYLARLVGPNLLALTNEIEKLALYVVGHSRPITPDDVTLLVPYKEEAEDFGLSNAIGQRNSRQAYDQLRKQLDDGRHPMVILASIATQVRNLIEVKDMAERGMTATAIAQAKGWRSDYAAKARLRDARNFSMARLERTLEALLETDLAIKTGRTEALLALEMLVGRLCGSR